jgi:hypothetical protein
MMLPDEDARYLEVAGVERKCQFTAGRLDQSQRSFTCSTQLETRSTSSASSRYSVILEHYNFYPLIIPLITLDIYISFDTSCSTLLMALRLYVGLQPMPRK